VSSAATTSSNRSAAATTSSTWSGGTTGDRGDNVLGVEASACTTEVLEEINTEDDVCRSEASPASAAVSMSGEPGAGRAVRDGCRSVEAPASATEAMSGWPGAAAAAVLGRTDILTPISSFLNLQAGGTLIERETVARESAAAEGRTKAAGSRELMTLEKLLVEAR
jgi:hypothetical protein